MYISGDPFSASNWYIKKQANFYFTGSVSKQKNINSSGYVIYPNWLTNCIKISQNWHIQPFITCLPEPNDPFGWW